MTRWLKNKTSQQTNASGSIRTKVARSWKGSTSGFRSNWINGRSSQIPPWAKAIAYMLNHWGPLTLFLRVPGAPLDNNICEQLLKRAILHRKNALFFKTEHGAYIGDLFMSLIHTCTLNHVNPFHYLTTLQKHSSELFKNPKRWLPWNYHQTVTNLT